MAVTVGIHDASEVMSAMYARATGVNSTEPVNADNFVSIATTLLEMGTDPIMEALSFVLSRTIFAERPYDAKFKSLELSQEEWGNITRKINFLDGSPLSPDQTYTTLTGDDNTSFYYGSEAPTPWYGKELSVAQTNFYGQVAASDSFRIREAALRGAFKGPDEFAAFLSNAMTFIENRHAQFIESIARGTVANYIAGKVQTADVDANPDKIHVIHLLTEYNAQTGMSLTAQSVYAPENFKAFMAWVYAKIASISDFMTDRTRIFNTDLSKDVSPEGEEGVNTLYVLRHTPKADQRVILYSPIQHAAAARALADTYHDSYLKYTDVELVNNFGDVSKRDSVSLTGYAYLKTDGSGERVTGGAKTVNNIFGLIIDRNAAGYMRNNTRVLTSPYNAADQSYTLWWHLIGKWVNDFSENGVVLLLD